MRITGMASGMDIDSMVKDLMKAHRIPVDRLGQKKQTLEWQRDNYKEMNAKLVDFRTKVFNLNLESNFRAQKSTVTGETAAVSAKATNTAAGGTITVKVDDLATAASVRSSTGITKNLDMDKTIQDLMNDNELEGITETSITINGSVIEFDPSTDTMSTILKKINSDSKAKVSAFYDSVSGSISLTSKETGNINGDGYIAISGDLLTNSFKLGDGIKVQGKDAQLVINNVPTTRSSNKFTINGVEITLNAKSVGGAASVIETKADTDKVVDSIKTFINDYNDLISKLNSKVKEERNRNFSPLTPDQKKDMKEDEVKNWEEKAKSGLLKNDSILKKAINDLRLDLATPVQTGDPAEDTIIDSIGITTGQWFENGKLILKDEAKLRAAIESDPDKVIQLFTSKGDTDSPDPARRDVGILQRMYDDLGGVLDLISEKAGTSRFSSSTDNTLKTESTLGKQIDSLTSSIASKNRRLVDLENHYYKQFSAMEQAMNKFNSQSGYLANAFG